LSWFCCNSSLAVLALSSWIPATLYAALSEASSWIFEAVAMVLAQSIKLLTCEAGTCITPSRSRDALPKLNVEETDAPLIDAALANMGENAAQSAQLACFEIETHAGDMQKWFRSHGTVD
jgi:hypothetical protein